MSYESEHEIIQDLAQKYLEKPETNPETRQAYRDLAEYNLEKFEDIPVDVEFTADDPYSCYEEMVTDIEENNHMAIFSEGTHPEHMSREENIKGRAVHDYFGHFKNGCDFSFKGEFQKWYNQKEEVPDTAEEILFSEVVGQTALVHYLDEGFESEDFEQKAFVYDSEVINEVVEYMS